MTKDDVKAEVKITLEDTLQQIGEDRIDSAVSKAFKDSWVTTRVVDNTLTFSISTFEYTLPSTITVVESIKIQTGSVETPRSISADLWSVVNGKLYFEPQALAVISQGDKLYLQGRYKLTENDTIPASDLALQNYVPELACWIILKQLAMSKAVAFLRNDTSMAELVNLRREVENDMLKYRLQLERSYIDN